MKIYVRANDELPEDNVIPNRYLRIQQAKETDSADLLELYAYDPEDSVREAVGGNPNTPANILTDLSEDESTRVRYAVAGNVNTPPSVLSELSYDEGFVDWNLDYVFVAALQNPNTPKSALLAEAGGLGGKYIALNPNVDEEVFNAMIDANLDYDANTSAAWNTIYAIIMSPYVTESILKRLADAPELDKRGLKEYIYKSPAMSDSLIPILVKHDIWDGSYRKDPKVEEIHNRLGAASWYDTDGRIIAKAVKKQNPWRSAEEIANYIVNKYSEFKDDYEGIYEAVR